MPWIQNMYSEMPSNTYNHSNARLFSDLMKITVVIESLSLKQSNVLSKRKTLPKYSNTTEWETYTKRMFVYFLSSFTILTESNLILINFNSNLNYLCLYLLILLSVYPISSIFGIGPFLLLVLLIFFLLFSLESPSNLILPLKVPVYIELWAYLIWQSGISIPFPGIVQSSANQW